MTDDKRQLRAELQDAIAKVRHQIEIQELSDHYVGSEAVTVEAVSELQSELVRLEGALADLERRG